MEPERRLIGTYRLVSFESIADDGEVMQPFGENPAGFAMYTAQGYMSAILMMRERQTFPEGDILAAGDRERAEAFASSSAYAGRWEIVDGRIVHHLEATTFPNWTGTTQVREFELTDSHLTLFPPRMLMQGKIRRGRVHFERMA